MVRNGWRKFGFSALLGLLSGALPAVPAKGSTPIQVGPDSGSGFYGIAKYMDWFETTPTGGCVPGPNGACVGTQPQGDTYFWTAWLPSAGGLPVPSGLPVVGTINDWNFAPCSGNIGIVQMDKFSWSDPAASHMALVNCLSSFGIAGADTDRPVGWKAKLYSADTSASDGTWKSRTPFSKGGILYLPVGRQISAGTPAVHDMTMIMSPDSGRHWCNPNTYFNHAGSPGCDATNWQADGDAPRCDAADNSSPCTNPIYFDPAHSSVMWKNMPADMYQWLWVNYGNQDGTAPPAVSDGCDPSVYTCFITEEGTLARVPNGQIMDVSAWRYYSCPSTTHSARCSSLDPASWSPNFADRTSVVFPAGAFLNCGGLIYLKEFGGYVMTATARSNPTGLALLTATAIEGPWKEIFHTLNYPITESFFSPSPALGYNVLSVSPPHVQLTFNSNSYKGGAGSPQIGLWDLAAGVPPGPTDPRWDDLHAYISGAGFEFNDAGSPGTFPATGLAWSFDFLDQGINSSQTSWSYFVDRGNNSAVIKACNAGSYSTPGLCGGMNPGRGTAMNADGIQTSDPGYAGHFRSFISEFTGDSGSANAPASMQGNGSYTVVGVYRYDGVTNFVPGGIWSTGSSGANVVELNQNAGTLQLDWGQTFSPHYQYKTSFTFPDKTRWYFVAVAVQAQTGACGSSCVPAANVWVGGAVTPGVLTDVNAGGVYTAVNGTPASKTPAVAAGPLVLGMNANNNASVMTTAATIIYNRALSAGEVQQMYQSMKTKLAPRGIALDGNAPPTDTTPPVISAVASSSVTASGAQIAWDTNELSDTQVDYGPTLSYGRQTPLDATATLSHQAMLSDLVPGTLYHYRVRSRDAATNLALSGDQTLTTLPAGQVTLGPTSTFSLRVYPNPWREDKHAARPMIFFEGVRPGTTLKIFTLAAHQVKVLHGDGPTLSWDLTDEKGERAASGVYLYLLTDSQGARSRGKLTLLR